MKTTKNRISTALKLSVMVLLFLSTQTNLFAASKQNSKISGVQIGTITYSFRSIPDQTLDGILNAAKEAGLSSVELMGGAVEQFAGIPASSDPQVIRKWRSTVSMDKFKEARKLFNSNGIKINILKLGEAGWSDEEIDYVFNACKALGAQGITSEISEESAARFAPFAEKHNLYAIFHNHGQPGNPNFSFDRVLAKGPKIMLNLDCGHYFGATGESPVALIKRLHTRIVSFHIKDKTGPKAAVPNKNQVWGEGETPIADILNLIKKEKWPITCDIELEYTVPANSDAVKEVAKCLDYCKTALTVKK
jgi:sugar phosphate isomerase/epimerase